MSDDSRGDLIQTDSNGDARTDPVQFSAENQPRSWAVEFLEFLLSNKKWWLAPVLIMGLLMGALALVTNSRIVPFIYTLF